MQNGLKNVSDFFPRYRKAAFEKDIQGMIDLYDDDVLVFDMWGKGFVSGIKDWSAIITDWLTSLRDEKVRVAFEKMNLQEDERIGFASALIQFRAIAADNRVLRSMTNRISLGFVKRDGHWKVQRQHTSAPIDSSLKAILEI